MEFQKLPLLIISTGVWDKEKGGETVARLKEMQASNCIRGYSIVPGDQILGVVETTPSPIVIVIKDTPHSMQLVEEIVSLKKDLTGIDVIRVKYSADATQASSLHSRNAEHFVGPADLWNVVARTIEKHLPTAKERVPEEPELPSTKPQTSENAQPVSPQSGDEKTKAADISKPSGVSEKEKAEKESGGWFARLQGAFGRTEKPSPERDHSTPTASMAKDNAVPPAEGVPIILTYKTIYVVATRDEIEAAQKVLGNLSRFLAIKEVPASLVTSNLALRPAVVVIGPRNVLDASGVVDGDLVRVLICDERGMNKYVTDLPEGKVVHPKTIPVEIAKAIKYFLKML